MCKNYPNGKRFGSVARMMISVNGERQYSTPYIPENLNWSSSEFAKMMSGITTMLRNFTRSFAGMHDFARRFLYSAVFNARIQEKLQQGIWSKICPQTPIPARMCLEGLQNSLTFSLFPKKHQFGPSWELAMGEYFRENVMCGLVLHVSSHHSPLVHSDFRTES